MSSRRCCPVVELRQYTLNPGMRDTLIELFEREFVETQEAVGMELIGQFRDADRPDRFVWLRGFADMETRSQSLGAFYGGPAWKAHRDAANATMIDSDNVLLLQPAWPGSGFVADGSRAPLGSSIVPDGLIAATIYYFDAPATDEFIHEFRNNVVPLCEKAGATLIAAFVTNASANNFPALPVREGENVFVSFFLYAGAGAAAKIPLPPSSERSLASSPETLHLLPTPPVSTARLAIEWRQIEPADALGIGQNVDLHDLAAGNGESEDGEWPPVRAARQDSDVAVHEDDLVGQPES